MHLSASLLVWALVGFISATVGVNSQLANSSTLQSLFSSSLQPLAVNFLPANSKVFFVSPNQTVGGGQFAFAPSRVSQPNLLVFPNGLLSNANIESNLIGAGPNGAAPTQVEVAQPVQNIASIENNTLLLQNPFAGVPYQSNTETINSLIANIFNNLSLQTLPPEELIFGALPSPNATVTRTFVETVFDDAETGTQPPSAETSTDDAPVDNSKSDIEPDVNQLTNNLSTFGDVVRVNEEWGDELPKTIPESTTLPSTKVSFAEEPVTVSPVSEGRSLVPATNTFGASVAPATVTPVAPTMSAEFESNRIESIPPWSTINRIVRPPSRLSFQPAPQFAPNTTPISAAIVPQFVTRPPPPTVSPQVFKPVKPTKLNTQSRKQKLDRQFFKTTLPVFTGKSLFRFEMNNQKIVGNSNDISSDKPSLFKAQKKFDFALKSLPKLNNQQPFYKRQPVATTKAPQTVPILSSPLLEKSKSGNQTWRLVDRKQGIW